MSKYTGTFIGCKYGNTTSKIVRLEPVATTGNYPTQRIYVHNSTSFHGIFSSRNTHVYVLQGEFSEVRGYAEIGDVMAVLTFDTANNVITGRDFEPIPPVDETCENGLSGLCFAGDQP